MISLIAMLALDAAPLNLVCQGSGSRTDIYNRTPTSFGFADQVSVEIIGQQGRIRIPSAMFPDIRSGGQNGWWRLSDIVVTDREIRARFRFNMLNRPRVLIDRITGHLSINAGRGQFSAECEAYDESTMPRRF